MKKIFGLIISVLALSGMLTAQTLNIQVGQVTYQFPAEQAGVMTYSNGTELTVMDKTFTLADVATMYVNEEAVTDNTVAVVYNNNTAYTGEYGYGTYDNLIEFIKSAEGNFTYVEGDSLPSQTDDLGNRLGYTFTVDSIENGKATLTFIKK